MARKLDLRSSQAHDGELPEHQRKYLEWLTTPPKERDPSTKTEYARQAGVTVESLRLWTKNPFFRKEWDQRLNELNIRPDRTQEVIDAMHKNATNGDTKAMELYLRMVEKISPPKIVLEDKGVEQMTDEELAQALAERQKHLRAV